MAHVVLTKDFTNCLRKLAGGNAQWKRAAQKCKVAVSEVGMEGAVKSLLRTHHGESRLPNIEKFDLGDGQRLVVQLIDGKSGLRAFLYAGDHEDTERWLNNHKDYRWVKKPSDGTLAFTQLTVAPPQPVPDIDVESPPDLLKLPLLRDFGQKHWKTMDLGAAAETYASEVTGESWELDSSGVIAHLETLAGEEKACLLCDLFAHAHKREWESLYRRIDLEGGLAKVAEPAETAASMLSIANSETFVTWEEAADLPLDGEWSDWMLFLHPEQKKLARQDFSGPARLRGVSGSGKTCVLLHRAKYLAKRYQLPVRIITLTASTQKLLNNLIARLCGVESRLIHVSTLATFASEVLQHKAPSLLSSRSELAPERLREFEAQAVAYVRQHAAFESSPMKAMDIWELRSFVVDEINYIRGRLQPREYDLYVTKQFRRRGRKIALLEQSRRIFLDVVRWWDEKLGAAAVRDYHSFIATALEVVEKNPKFLYRAVLIDEVQDLSQLEIAFVSRLQTPAGEAIGTSENALFLVGDGAQTIYKKGFSLASVGVSVANRSYVLQKNYRNSKEILLAAFRLISAYEFADVDEDNVQKPTEPHYANRHGEKPCLIKCDSDEAEIEFVARHVRNLIDADHVPGQIGVIGFTKNARETIARVLKAAAVPSIELREDADFDSPFVKISTVESAKGHEFSTVFVIGLNEGVIPAPSTPQDELSREASRLYVAMTRARDTLYLSYKSDEHSRPSEFLVPIAEDCVELEYSDAELRRARD